MDEIRIDGIRALGTHGILPEERGRAQPFQVDVTLGVDLGPAGRSDNLDDTVDYGEVTEQVVGIISGKHRDLIETLAAEIASVCLSHSRVAEVTVRVTKVRPPLPADVHAVSVEVHRISQTDGHL
ncbi:MAG: dihydroneopterin aldolase [Actinobacteria bacterium]|nr:dihydroneopterin aldolase [Actinomycetota bacterium]MCB9389756.1 dihydroneopterin aldolase [Acidimicrobiia bacterium]